ncbi:hypothetical protein K439DRAFT_1366216, partial [Ramaria rubella]
FIIMKLADMQAIKANQYIKGPNTFLPCQTCQIQGCHNPDSPTSNYHYPLTAPTGFIQLDHSLAVDWDPATLPLRTDATYAVSLLFIQKGPTQTKRVCWAKTQGINGVLILGKTPGFSHSLSCPHKFMHLIFEKMFCNLVDLWNRQFKGLNKGTEDYCIPQHIWELVGTETAASKSWILSAFAWPIPNITKEHGIFTAEAWAVWFIYLALHLLQGQLALKYYDHMILLITIVQICLQFIITDHEINVLEQMMIWWVHQYEQDIVIIISTWMMTAHSLYHNPRYYYQFNKQ